MAASALVVAVAIGFVIQRADTATAAPSTMAGETAAPVSGADPVGMGDYAAADFQSQASALPADLATALDRDLNQTPAEYLAQSAAASDAVEVVSALEDAGVDVGGSRLDGTTLVVTVETPADIDQVEALGGVAEVGIPEVIDVSALEFSPALDVTGGEGYTWSTSAGSYQCSIGFAGHRLSDGQPMAVTAGHCTNGMNGITGSIRQFTQTAPGTIGTRGAAIGSPLPGASAFGGGYDGGLITLDAGVASTSSVLTWGGGAAAPQASAPLPVTGMGAAIAGATLCKSGSRTGWTCGVVRAVDYSLSVGGNPVNSIIATTCLQPGDSGGAALIGQMAVGINSSTSNVACGTSGYISGFFPMVSAGGRASVQAQFGSIWEPAFSVSAAKVGSMSVAEDGAVSMIGGTVAATSSTSRVAVFADSASTPLTTVGSSSGTWSVSIAALVAGGLTSGEHELRFVSMTGARSSAPPTLAQISVSGNKIVTALLPSAVVSR